MAQETKDFAIEFNNIEPKEYSPRDNNPSSLKLNHQSVQKIINIALELSKENRLITSELLYNVAKKVLKIPGGGLKEIIQMLFSKRILVDSSRFTKINVLRNKTRSYIYHLIKTHIGAHFSFLKSELSQLNKNKMGVGHFTWHLEKLLSFNLIKKVKVKNYTIFLPVEISPEEGILYFVLRDAVNKLIISLLLERGTVNKMELYNELNVKRAKIYYRLKNLVELGIISPKSDDKKTVSINSDKKDLIKKIILNIFSRNSLYLDY
ncbi:MAG: hypothetical protein ACFE8E_02660 [Candidatus Hodarchaeota archaeon]